MTTDFWSSSHYKRWIVDRETLRQSRSEDLRYVDDPEHLDFLAIYFANTISKLGKKLQLRQRVIATATVFFRRFYLKNSYCETDPFIVISACCYVAAKAEESPVHIKNVVTESRSLFSQEIYGVKNFPSDNSKLAEMEFYLVDDLECDLTVFHPYRTLLTLCRKEGSPSNTTFPDGFHEAEAGELGAGIGPEDGTRYWGTGEGQLELNEGALQVAWFIINDTYRSDLCLLYPPHLIAIAAIYLTLILHTPTRDIVTPLLSQRSAQPTTETSRHATPNPTQPRRSSRQVSNNNVTTAKKQDPIAFLAQLNVSMPLVANIAQEIISLYSLWDRYKEDSTPESSRSTRSSVDNSQSSSPFSSMAAVAASNTSATGVSSLKRPAPGSGSNPGTPSAIGGSTPTYVTPELLSKLVIRMRENKMADLAHPASGRPVAVNKMLERAQAAG